MRGDVKKRWETLREASARLRGCGRGGRAEKHGAKRVIVVRLHVCRAHPACGRELALRREEGNCGPVRGSVAVVHVHEERHQTIGVVLGHRVVVVEQEVATPCEVFVVRDGTTTNFRAWGRPYK